MSHIGPKKWHTMYMSIYTKVRIKPVYIFEFLRLQIHASKIIEYTHLIYIYIYIYIYI